MPLHNPGCPKISVFAYDLTYLIFGSDKKGAQWDSDFTHNEGEEKKKPTLHQYNRNTTLIFWG